MNRKRISINQILFALWAIVMIFAFISTAQCQSVTGNIAFVQDADTVKFRAQSGKYYTVRLAGVDAPELKQSYGLFCRDSLRSFVVGKTFTLYTITKDSYGRFLGQLSTASAPDLSLWLIESGCAWSYHPTPEKRDSYIDAEARAQIGEINLWSDLEPIRPETFRLIQKCEGVGGND